MSNIIGENRQQIRLESINYINENNEVRVIDKLVYNYRYNFFLKYLDLPVQNCIGISLLGFLPEYVTE